LNLGKRILVSVIIIPLAVLAIHMGGWVYSAVIIALLVAAAWEYIKLLKIIKLQPAIPLVLSGVFLLSFSRAMFQFNYSSAVLTALLLAIAAYHIIQYERGETNPSGDFGASISVLLYIGFLGSFLISLRALPDGKWWTFLAKTSPNKTWEGYLGELIFGVLGGIGLILLYNRVFEAGLEISLWETAALSLIISALVPLGDLTESMIKRTAGKKDSGTLLPGHGGIFDRIDSLFWAAPIAYYLILLLFL
jgi:phosphatidate cytidylyltransferase